MHTSSRKTHEAWVPPRANQAEMRLPDLHRAQLEDVVFLPHVSLQAILALDSPDVDLRLWNETIVEMEASGTSVPLQMSCLALTHTHGLPAHWQVVGG